MKIYNKKNKRNKFILVISSIPRPFFPRKPNFLFKEDMYGNAFQIAVDPMQNKKNKKVLSIAKRFRTPK